MMLIGWLTCLIADLFFLAYCCNMLMFPDVFATFSEYCMEGEWIDRISINVWMDGVIFKKDGWEFILREWMCKTE